MLTENLHPDTSAGEQPELPRYEANRDPGSTADVDYWTSKEVRPIVKSHLNYVVADTARWEQQAAYFIDTHPDVVSFAKNAGLGFGIPYLHNGDKYDYVPDFLVRPNTPQPLTLILEMKGYDLLKEVKQAAADRWVNAVNADGSFCRWAFRMLSEPGKVRDCISEVVRAARG